MPTYQYACTECGHELEAVQSFSDAPLAECPACQGKLRKRFNSVGIVFKGSGFYRTDSRSAAGATGAGNGAKVDAAPANGSAGKDSAAKPADSSSTGNGSGGSSSSTPAPAATSGSTAKAATGSSASGS